MSERRSLPPSLTGRRAATRSNRADAPVTTRTNIAPLQWVRKPAGVNLAGIQLYSLYVRNPLTGDEALVAGPI